MIGATIKTERGTSFAKVEAAAKRAERRYYFRAAGFVRTTIKRSFGKKGKKPAAAGRPPRSQTGAIRRSILFAVEQTGAVIGAAAGFGRSGTAAKALEHGGRSVFFGRDGSQQTAEYAARPFAAPGLETASPHLPQLWNGAVNAAAKS